MSGVFAGPRTLDFVGRVEQGSGGLPNCRGIQFCEADPQLVPCDSPERTTFRTIPRIASNGSESPHGYGGTKFSTGSRHTLTLIDSPLTTPRVTEDSDQCLRCRFGRSDFAKLAHLHREQLLAPLCFGHHLFTD